MNDNKYSREIADKIEEFLDEDDWKYSFDSEKGYFSFGLSLNKTKIRKVEFIIRIRESDFVVYAICPINVNKDDTSAMLRISEFLHRANYGTFCGNFEFDFSDGEIRYKTFVDCDNMALSTDAVRNAIYTSASEFEKYGDGILEVIFTENKAEDVYEKFTKKYFEELIERYANMKGSDDNDEDDDDDDDDDDDVIDDIFSSLIDDDDE